LERAISHFRSRGLAVTDADLAHLSPLGWEHINLTGDYHWDMAESLGPGELRPLRALPSSIARAA
jgi:hypothetical protein